MPRTSQKQREISYALDMVEACEILPEEVKYALSLDDEEFEVFKNENLRFLETATTSRYSVSRRMTERNDDYLIDFFEENEDVFRQTVRMGKDTFWMLVDEIQCHSVFQNRSHHAQRTPMHQLVVALERLGSSGNRSSLARSRHAWAVGHGTAISYTRRVITAILSLQEKFMYWPDQNGRRQTAKAMAKEGFPGCIGFVDGIYTPLHQRPRTDPDTYWDKHQQYSMNTQIVCNCDGRIISMTAGYQGSAANADIYEQTKIAMNPSRYFNHGQYLLADSNYGLCHTVITPFKGPAADSQINSEFNTRLAKARTRNEDALGILKERWASLKGLRLKIDTTEDSRHVVEWILACCVLHNIMMDFGDNWVEQVSLDNNDSNGIESIEVPETAAQFREAIRDFCVVKNHETGRSSHS